MQGVDTYHWILPSESLAESEKGSTSCWFPSSMSMESWQISTSYEKSNSDGGADYLGLWLKVKSVTKLAADEQGSVIGLHACVTPIHSAAVSFGSEDGWAMITSTCSKPDMDMSGQSEPVGEESLDHVMVTEATVEESTVKNENASATVQRSVASMPKLPVSFLNTRYQLSILGGDGEVIESLCNLWDPCLDPYEYRGCAKFVELSRLKNLGQIVIRLELQYSNVFGSIQPLTLPISPIAPFNLGLAFGDSVVSVNRVIFCRTRAAVAAFNSAPVVATSGNVPVIDFIQYVPDRLQHAGHHWNIQEVYSVCLTIIRSLLYKKCASTLNSSLQAGVDRILLATSESKELQRILRLDILVILGCVFAQLHFHYLFHLVKQQLIADVAGQLSTLIRLHRTILRVRGEPATQFEIIIWTELIVILMKRAAEERRNNKASLLEEKRQLTYFAEVGMTKYRAVFVELLARRQASWDADNGSTDHWMKGITWLKSFAFDVLTVLTNECIRISLANRKPPGFLLASDSTLPDGMLHIPYAA